MFPLFSADMLAYRVTFLHNPSMNGDIGHFTILAIALLAEAAVGDPALIWQRVPHPLDLLERFASYLDIELNVGYHGEQQLRWRGVLAVGLILVSCFGVGLFLSSILSLVPNGWVLEVVIVYIFVAGRNSFQEMDRAVQAFEDGDLATAGQFGPALEGEPEQVTTAEAVERRMLERAAWLFTRGFVAPVFWYAVLGLPALLAVRGAEVAVRVMGEERKGHEIFGTAASRFDFAVQALPGVVGGLLVTFASLVLRPLDHVAAFRAVLKQGWRQGAAGRANTGWILAAIFGGLGKDIEPRDEGDGTASDADGAMASVENVPESAAENAPEESAAVASDLRSALTLFKIAGAAMFALVVLAVLVS